MRLTLAAGHTIGQAIARAVLTALVVLAVLLLSVLALLFTLVCAPPLKRLADFPARDQTR